MIQWLRRERRTRTPVHNLKSQREEASSGRALAYRLLAALLMLAQQLLWLLWQGYDGAGQAAWQATLLLALPLLALRGLWAAALSAPEKAGANAGQAAPLPPAVRGALALLLPCLMLDEYFLLTASFSLMRSMIPSFPDWACVLVVALLPLLSAWEGRENGVAYGAHALRVVLLALFVLSTLLSLGDARPSRLWPLLGGGAKVTAWTALGGTGAVWGVALLYALPRRAARKAAEGKPALPEASVQPAGWLLALLPLCLCLLWALWLGMTRPWLPGDGLNLGRKLVNLSRYSASILICEAGALFWMLLLPICLCGCLCAGEKLLKTAAPRLPRGLGLLLPLLPGVLVLCLHPGGLWPPAIALSPWRGAVAAIAAAAVLWARKGAEP